jgi:integrase
MPKATKSKPTKPGKPYPDFPLFPHATRRWAKKIRGKIHYFGPWNDWQAALNKYQEQRDDLHAGRSPRVKADGPTVRELCTRFMTAKEIQRNAGDITPRTFTDYLATCKLVVDSFGKDRLVDDLAADDFEQLRTSLAKTRNPNTLGNEVQRVRVAFKYGYDAGMIDRPMRFGPTFKRPAKRILRALRQKRGGRMFESVELREIIKAADQPLRAMILLGVNCGFGNADCGTLPQSALDLKAGWVDFPRPKTAIERRCPLWPETIESIQESIAIRPKAKQPDHKHLLFITKYGHPWAKETPDSPVTKEMRKLLNRLKLHRPGLGFYALRHTFETIAGESRDQVATSHIMGHANQSMAAVYHERISDERLRDVTDYVRSWLFSPNKKSVKSSGLCICRPG